MVINIFYVIGVIGLALIISGILVKNKNRALRDLLYIFGGLALLLYSIHIGDYIFIALQAVFTLVAIYDSIKTSSKKRK